MPTEESQQTDSEVPSESAFTIYFVATIRNGIFHTFRQVGKEDIRSSKILPILNSMSTRMPFPMIVSHATPLPRTG